MNAALEAVKEEATDSPKDGAFSTDPRDYGWGVDGFGRAAICLESDGKILFHGLPGVPGLVLIYTYIDNRR